MEAKDILIRLLKDGHITNEEFKFLYPNTPVLEWNREYPQQPMPIEPFNPIIYPYWEPKIWHGINHPSTGEPLAPTFTATSGYWSENLQIETGKFNRSKYRKKD